MNKVIIFPTDTVYGIGTGFLSEESIKRIYEIKGRDFNKPLAILTSSLKQLENQAYISEDAHKLADAFWPGGLTIILKSKEEYYKLSGEKTIGVRMPNHKLALELLKLYGPLKTTSVNQSGESPMNDYQEIYKKYSKMVDQIFPNEETSSEVSSTVVDLTQEKIQILREGDIKLSDIMKVLSK